MRPCAKCGKEKEPEKQNDSYCRACRTAQSRESRLKAALAKGHVIKPKNPSGKGRSPLCSKCKQEKGPGRENESYCKPCKSERKKELNAQKREAAGLRPYGSGRKPTCCTCGGFKENENMGNCNACHAKKARERRLINKLTPEFIEKERNKVNRRYNDDPLFKLKKLVRLTTNRYIKDGFLLQEPCEVCGAEKVDAHHDDYMKPLEVRWLCRKHHMEHHRNERLLNELNEDK